MLDDPAVALTILVLALFVGFEVISKVPPLLHTPLMSGSNAISGITIVGALLAAGHEERTLSINVVGGFLVTNRMLAMFKPKRDRS
jgi:NAD(P) transhydrogenase subunit alpha